MNKNLFKNIIILLIFLILTWLIGISIYFANSPVRNNFNKKPAINLYPQAVLSVQNCEQTGNRFFTLHEDPQIYISPPKYKILSTLIEFAEPITIDSSVKIYYANKNEDLSEKNSVLKLLPKGSSEVIIDLPSDIFTTLRYDIDIFGEWYEIKGIYVSKAVVINSTLFITLVISICIFVLWILGIRTGKIDTLFEKIINVNKKIKYSIINLVNKIYKLINDIQNKKFYLYLLFFIILACLIGISIYYLSAIIFNAPTVNNFDKETATSLYPKAVLSMYNYEQTDNPFFTLHNDPQIFFLPPKHKVSSTLIEFVEPISNDASVQVYYTENEDGFLTDENSVVKYLQEGNSEIVINLPPGIYTSLRYDIQIIGESYEIKGIYVSEKESGQLFFRYSNYFILSCFFILVALIIFLIIKRVSIEYLYLAAGMGIGLFYLFLMTPLSIPDERTHYNSTHMLVNNLLFQENKNIYKLSNFDYSNLRAHYNVSSAYIRFAKEGIHRINDSKYGIISGSYIKNYFVWYIPQALGVLIARFLSLNFFGVFYLGRLTNLIFYVLCVFLAIKVVNEFKLPFFFIGLLPMTMHQAASFSYDAFINGISMVFIAYFIRILYESNKLETKDITALSITGILLAPAKLVYFPIVLLVFLALPEHFGWKKAKGYIAAIGIFIIGLVMLLLFNYNELFKTTQQSAGLNWERQHNYTFSFILEHPQQTATIFLNTFISSGIWYYRTMIGRYLSGLSLLLPEWYISVFLLILIGSVFYGKKVSWNPKWLHRSIFLLIIFSVILLCMLSMFLFWTSDTRDIIQGVQGRYFIPLIPLGLLIVRNKLKVDNNIYSFVLIGCIIAMQFFTIKYIFNATIGL